MIRPKYRVTTNGQHYRIERLTWYGQWKPRHPFYRYLGEAEDELLKLISVWTPMPIYLRLESTTDADTRSGSGCETGRHDPSDQIPSQARA